MATALCATTGVHVKGLGCMAKRQYALPRAPAPLYRRMERMTPIRPSPASWKDPVPAATSSPVKTIVAFVEQHAVEAIILGVVLCMFASVMHSSMQALVVYSMKGAGAGTTTSAASLSASALGSSTAAAGPSSPVIVLLRGLAATFGVIISSLAHLIMEAPGMLLRLVQGLVLSLFGSLLHML
mmetsp:Transcript_35362/g.89533  ORF Transcript_35362/g.89533 Transcript_35362/m.89533 type:complete len:183 (+) Transcript_35362:110-658(+)